MVNMAASRKATKDIDNATSSEQTTIKNFSTILTKDDKKNNTVSTGQCMSGINLSNNCISKLNNQNIEITGLSKHNPMHIKKLLVQSQHALFFNVCTQKHVTDFSTTGCHLCYREPSRIQVKWLTRKFGKSRLLRKCLRHIKIKRSVPRSSYLHYIVENIKQCQDIRMKCIPDLHCPKKVHKKCRTNRSSKDSKFYICEGILADIFYLSGSTHDLYAQHVFKNVNHLKKVCQSALCTDIETNPGPVFYIDPSKTISAPYSQGNQIIFGETAGQQCLAMCLCALIYNKRQNICSPEDLINVMNIGNELYSNLSCLAQQSFLLFTELPSQLTVFDTDYIFEYSESYSGNVIGDCSIEGFQYCVPFHRSFELLLAENYSAFILTIDSNAVCIFSTTDGKYKIFDSHSRDIYGRSHPQGTCVLLEAPNINNVILYFQSLYSENSQFELRGINIEQVQANGDQNLNNGIRNSALSANASAESKSADVSCSCRQCCAISLYSICYAIIKPCNYWDSNTVTAVVYFGTTLYNNTGINASHDIPQKVDICGTEVHVKLQANIQGVLYDKAKSRLHIESLICHTNENTGFLIWFGDYCISCIFQKTSIKNMSYSILAYDDDDNSPTCTTYYIKNIKDKHTLVDVMFNLATTKIKDEIVNYEIQFLSCFSELTNCERKRIMKNHRQNYINDFIEPGLKKRKLETKQMRYKTMEPLVKQQVNSKHVNDYKIIAHEKKQKILENRKTKYEMLDKSKKEELLTKNMNYRKTMNKGQKQKILENKRIKYEAMDHSNKGELLTKNMNYKGTMTEEQKQKILENKRVKYEAMDLSRKEELLTKNMNYKETMGEEQKQKLLENKRVKYQAMDISKKKELSAMSSSKIMLNRMSLDPKQKNDLLTREKEKRMEKKSLTHDIDMCIQKFKK
ncbi:ATP-dependent DNA helicase PIF1 [Paramuricea clavata]|uniref:ATP-dependent DNA helicase PIF1 n=1 Tax=Paramuricea clavata TaxID=317549 RepID=A0A7D9DHH3_PARCT|nr:ATP-dependent DNA helicase PIF1 [Paramuricea clavata]